MQRKGSFCSIYRIGPVFLRYNAVRVEDDPKNMTGERMALQLEGSLMLVTSDKIRCFWFGRFLSSFTVLNSELVDSVSSSRMPEEYLTGEDVCWIGLTFKTP